MSLEESKKKRNADFFVVFAGKLGVVERQSSIYAVFRFSVFVLITQMIIVLLHIMLLPVEIKR